MEKLTISKIIGVYDAQFNQKRVGFSTNEHGSKQISGFFPETSVPKEGETVEGDIVTKEKDGKTYTNFVLPKKSPQKPSGMSDEQFNRIMVELRAINTNLNRVFPLVEDIHVKTKAGRLSDGSPMPDFDPGADGGISESDPY